MDEEKAKYEDIVREAITECAKEDGWTNLADLGTFLRKKNIRYGKLSRFLSNYSEIVETRVDESIEPPAVYARLIA